MCIVFIPLTIWNLLTVCNWKLQIHLVFEIVNWPNINFDWYPLLMTASDQCKHLILWLDVTRIILPRFLYLMHINIFSVNLYIYNTLTRAVFLNRRYYRKIEKTLLTWYNGPNVVGSTLLSINWYFRESTSSTLPWEERGRSHSKPDLSLGSTELSGCQVLVGSWFSRVLNGPLNAFSIDVKLKLHIADPAILFSGVVNAV